MMIQARPPLPSPGPGAALWAARPPLAAPGAPAAPHGPRAQCLAAVGLALLQRLEAPLFVTDPQGALLEANPAALRRLERCDGLWLDAARRVAVRQAGRWVPVSRWQPALAGGAEVQLPLDADGAAPWQLTLRAVQAGDGIPGDHGWLLGTVERLRLTRVDAMRRRFRFTQTQARLAELLCQGMLPVHAAERLGVKISTVRTHVGQMYEKTGTRTQAQLVALLHGD
jgi:DNA-binding CsgD family transcriptional regulator